MPKAKLKKASEKKTVASQYAFGDRVKVQSEHHKNSPGTVEICWAKTVAVRLDSQVHLPAVTFRFDEVAPL